MAEAAEKRKDAKVAREWELGLPVELNVRERRTLVRDFAQAIAARCHVAVDIAIYLPGRGGDIRNHHAHLLTTTRSYSAEAGTQRNLRRMYLMAEALMLMVPLTVLYFQTRSLRQDNDRLRASMAGLEKMAQALRRDKPQGL